MILIIQLDCIHQHVDSTIKVYYLCLSLDKGDREV